MNDLYKPAFKEDIPFVLGNYLKMINHIDELGGLSDGKKRELLLDGCRVIWFLTNVGDKI